MAKLQWRNLDIGFSPSVGYDFHLCTPLKASIQSVSTAPFILLITLTLGKPSGIPPGTYRCSLRMIFKMHSAPSLLCFFFPLWIYHLWTHCIITHLFCLLSVFPIICELHKSRTCCLFHLLLQFCKWERCLAHSRCSISNCSMKNGWVNYFYDGYSFITSCCVNLEENTQPNGRRLVFSVMGIIGILLKHQISPQKSACSH